MKKYLLLGLAMVVIAIVTVITMEMANVGSIDAFAGNATPTVGVNATVTAKCTASNDGKLEFGNIDPVTNAASATATVTPSTINCTKTAAGTYAVTAAGANGGTNMGAGYNVKNGANSIAYSITYNTPLTGKGFGAGNSIGGTGAGNLALTGSMGTSTSSGLDVAPAGAYTDTITLTIAY